MFSSNGRELVEGKRRGLEWGHLLLVRRLLGSAVWCAAHLNEADQAPVVFSPVEPTLADVDKNAILGVSDNNVKNGFLFCIYCTARC
jgi:hypothetical protein